MYCRLLLLCSLLAGAPYQVLATTLMLHPAENNASALLACAPASPSEHRLPEQDVELLACREEAGGDQRSDNSPTPEFRMDGYGPAPEESATAQPDDAGAEVEALGDFASVLAQVNLVDDKELRLRFPRRRLTRGKIVAVTIVVFVLTSVSLLFAGIRSLRVSRHQG